MNFKMLTRLFAAAALLIAATAAPSAAQPRTCDVDLTIRSATVKSFTDAFTAQTGVPFSFDADLARKSIGNVDLHYKGAGLETILQNAFASSPIAFRVSGGMVVLSMKETAAAPKADKDEMMDIQGIVQDSFGDPLPGVGVLVKGTTTGVISDVNGIYRIRVKKGSVLEYSFIGYSTSNVTVADNSVINVTLREDTTLLEEVVVVGYGTQARKTLTTSIAKLDGDELMDAPVSSVGEAIKGKIAGMQVATANSLSGEAPRFMVRGGSSINMGNNPIYIVDGSLRDDLNGINPNDIESMEVLKDAASAGIYGARASNGVILITTRKGSTTSGPQIVFDAQMAIASPATKWDILGAEEYLSFLRPAIATALANDTSHPAATLLAGPNAYGTGNGNPNSTFSPRYLEYRQPVPEGYDWMYDPLDRNKVIIFTDTDWQSKWFRSNAVWHKEYVGVNGGNEQVKYAASASYMNDSGIVAMSNYDVFTMHGNTTFNITKQIQAGATFDMSQQTKHIPNDNYYQPIGRGIIVAPTAMEKNALGQWNQLGSNVNFHSPDWYETYYDRMNTTNRMSGTFNIKWNIFDFLTAHAQYNYYQQNYVGSYYAYGERDGVNNTVSTTRSTTETRTQTTRQTFTAHLDYNQNIKDTHFLSATAGYEYMRQQYVYLTANGTGSVSDDVPVIQSGVNYTASNKEENQVMISYFGRATYDFKHRYVLSGTFRADASSRFSPGNQWGFFPAGSAAWIVSEEPFWNKAGKMNNLKLRVSYGQTGNNGIGLYDTYGAFGTDVYHGNSILLPSKMQNTGMKWETTTQLDLGIDAGFFGDRLRFVLDYYNKVTDNMLFSITLPDTSPYGSVKANVGSAMFYGFEAEIHSVNIHKKDFSWSTDFTYAFSRNKVLSLPEEYAYDEVDEFGNLTGRTAYRIGGFTMTETGYRFGGTAVGEPLGRIYGYKIDHIIQTIADADAALYDSSSQGFRVSDGQRILGRKDAGDYEWCNRYGSARDENGNEIINSEDAFYLGSVVPHSIGGINNTFTWKGLTLNIYLDYALGHSIVNGMKTQMLKNTMGDCNSMVGRMVYDCWRYPGDTEAKYARYTPNDSDWGNKNWGHTSDFSVDKADYLCLRDVSLTYDLPEKWIKPLLMKKVTVGVSGNTLYYFTGATGAVSPETGIGSASGSDMYNAITTSNSDGDNPGNLMPPARKIIFSLKVTF